MATTSTPRRGPNFHDTSHLACGSPGPGSDAPSASAAVDGGSARSLKESGLGGGRGGERHEEGEWGVESRPDRPSRHIHIHIYADRRGASEGGRTESSGRGGSGRGGSDRRLRVAHASVCLGGGRGGVARFARAAAARGRGGGSEERQRRLRRWRRGGPGGGRIGGRIGGRRCCEFSGVNRRGQSVMREGTRSERTHWQ